MKKDYSKEIFERYFNSNGRLLRVSLKDGTVLEGIFVSFYHGDDDSDDPYIIKWHFVNTNEITDYYNRVTVDDTDMVGQIIEQKDIEKVEFK